AFLPVRVLADAIIFAAHANKFTSCPASLPARAAPRRVRALFRQGGRRNRRLVRAAPLRRGEGRHVEQGVGEGDQVLREARGAVSLWAFRAAGAARGRVLQFQGRRARLGDRRRR